jgi:hypothetical protein
MAYELEGSLLEVCNCNVLCPCWVGEDPDADGTCDAIVAYHIERGSVNGTDVSGLSFAFLNHFAGNILAGNWEVLFTVDDRASAEQVDALVSAWTGKLGGPLADLSGLMGKIIGVERVPIAFEVNEGKGSLKIGSIAEAEMEPFRGPTGQVTTLNESIFTTIAGAPAWVGKASSYQRRSASYGLKDIDLSGHNAIQGLFRFAG